MDYEEKKSIPESLRGAGKRRFRCRHCGGWHGNAMGIRFCKSNPGRKAAMADIRAMASKGGKAAMADPESRARSLAPLVRRNTDPALAEVRRAHSSVIGRLGGAKGERNSHWGKPMTPYGAARLAIGRARHQAREAPAVLERQLARMDIPTAIMPPAGFGMPTGGERAQDLWFPVDSDDGLSDF